VVFLRHRLRVSAVLDAPAGTPGLEGVPGPLSMCALANDTDDSEMSRLHICDRPLASRP
jgi:hypothetical protein